MMNERDRRVLHLFAKRVRAQFRKVRILAYGSRARGDGSWESDLDICVILPRVDRDVEKAISEIAWEVGFDHDVLISVVEFQEDVFERKARGRHPFVKHILRDGVAA